MAINGVDIVEQLRGRMKFYHVGDPVRRDLKWACDEIGELRGVQLQESHTGASVRDWLLDRSDSELLLELGVKLTPKQRKTLQANLALEFGQAILAD